MNLKWYVLITSIVILVMSGCIEEESNSKIGNGNDSTNYTIKAPNVTVIEEKEIPFETISKGFDSGHRERKNRDQNF